MNLDIEYTSFPERADRSRYVADRFRQYLQGRVLDVGCFEAPLRELLSDAEYTGIDFVGKPDIECNLEECEKLPFETGEFDCVICIDVLEHLDNLHLIFNELIRVSKKHIIVSLPNCWRDARKPIESGQGSFVHYGLPAERPNDRHKWFFNLAQARQFFEKQAENHGLEIKEMFATEKPKNPAARLIRKIRYPGERYNNRYPQTLWTVLEIGE